VLLSSLDDLYAVPSSPTLLCIARIRELAPLQVEHRYSPQPTTRRWAAYGARCACVNALPVLTQAYAQGRVILPAWPGRIAPAAPAVPPPEPAPAAEVRARLSMSQVLTPLSAWPRRASCDAGCTPQCMRSRRSCACSAQSGMHVGPRNVPPFAVRYPGLEF
jgi:hypothetical protein